MNKARLWAEANTPLLGCMLYFLISVPCVFFGGLWASAGIGAGVLGFVMAWVASGTCPKPRRDLMLFVSVFLVVIVGLGFDAAFPSVTWKKTGQMVSIAVPLMLLSCADVQARIGRMKFFLFWPFVMGFMTWLLALEQSLGMPLYRYIHGDDFKLAAYNRGFSYVLMMAWPVAAYFWRGVGRKYVLLFGLMLVPAFCLTESRAAQLATFVGLGVCAVAWFLPVLVRWGLALLVPICAMWPLGAAAVFEHRPEWLVVLAPSWRARMEIWDYLSFRIAERPLFGWGLGSAHKLAFESPHKALYTVMDGPAAHAHNAFVAFWVELGAVGLVLGCLFALMTLFWASKQPKTIVPFALAAWAAGFVLALCAYDFWTDSFLSMLALVCLTFAVVRQKYEALANQGAGRA